MSSETSQRTTAERITLGVSLAILVTVFGLTAWAIVRTGDGPPVITVEANLQDTRHTADRHYVPVTITNEGGLTAQDVVVTGELDTGEGPPETAEITLMFLAGGESETAELVFTTNPAEGDFTVGPTSFTDP